MGKNYSHLDLSERKFIYYMLVEGLLKRSTVSKVASALGRHRSSIYREMKRNRNSCCGYRPFAANSSYRGRLFEKSHKGKKLTDEICKYVKLLLTNFKFSPESIIYFIWLSFGQKLSKETIYRYVIQDKEDGGDLYTYLPRYRKYRRRVKGAHNDNPGNIQKRRIEERPSGCENKVEKGHLEADLIIGGGKEVILTMADRKNKYLVTKKLSSKNKEDTSKGIFNCLKNFPYKIKTITTDNGSEFFCFTELEKKLDIKFYFTNPYHSWEKGLIENLNGFIRIYLKKKTRFEDISEQTLQAITTIINLIPRETLNTKTAFETVKKLNKSNRIKIIQEKLNSIKEILKKNNFDIRRIAA